MTKIKIINDQASLDALCDVLADQPWLTMDTEFMREKTYAPILCLIQIGAADDAYCVDPLAIDNLDSFSELLGLPDQLKVLHSCRQDLEAFDTRLEHTIGRLFDTQLGAAFCGYGDQVSYAAMVESVTGVSLAKSHTRADWAARPLSDGELGYAMDDVAYLNEVRVALQQQLEDKGRLSWFEQECQRQIDPKLWKIGPETAWHKLKGAATLPIQAQATAKALAIWREQFAIDRNRPREWILATKPLLELSRVAPQTIEQLQKVDGINSGVARQSGEAILSICKTTPRDPDAEALWYNAQLLTPEQKKNIKSVMGFIRETAEAMQLSPSLIANRSVVEKFVRGERELELFSGWRHTAVGAEILDRFS